MVGEAIGGAVSGILGPVLNYVANERTNKKNVELVKYQNEYNTPVNQMSRFAEAGLNPNLMYGQGTPGNQSDVAQYQAPDLSQVDPMQRAMNVVQALKSMQVQDSVISLNKANESAIDSQNVQRSAETAMTQFLLLAKQLGFGPELEGLILDNAVKSANAANIASNTAINKQQFDYQAQANPIRLSLLGTEDKQAKWQYNVMSPALLNEALSRTGLNKMQSRLASSQAELNYDTLDNMRPIERNRSFVTLNKSIEELMRLQFGVGSDWISQGAYGLVRNLYNLDRKGRPEVDSFYRYYGGFK